MGTFLIIKVAASIFHLLGEIMRNVPIIRGTTGFAFPLLEAGRWILFPRE
jgi:hypothetical protein